MNCVDEYGRPRTVKIGPHVYRILYSKESWKKYAPTQRRRDNYGITLAEQCVILINTKRLNLSQMRDTVLHEVLHAIFALHGFATMPIDVPETTDLEEVIVLLLAPNVLNVMRENPHLLEWLTDETP